MFETEGRTSSILGAYREVYKVNRKEKDNIVIWINKKS